VDLASTLLNIAESTDDPERRAKLMRGVQKAVDAIRRFQERIVDKAIRAKLCRDADELERLVPRSDR
jgi:hypothetical protein